MTDTPLVDEPRRPLADRIDRLWRTVLPILGAGVGIAMILNEAFLKPKADLTIIGVGAIIAGIGPVGLAQFLKQGGPS